MTSKDTFHDEYRAAYLALETEAQSGRMTWEGAMARVALISIAYGEAKASLATAELVNAAPEKPFRLTSS